MHRVGPAHLGPVAPSARSCEDRPGICQPPIPEHDELRRVNLGFSFGHVRWHRAGDALVAVRR